MRLGFPNYQQPLQRLYEYVRACSDTSDMATNAGVDVL